jgi:hypothetical protein
VTPAAAKQPGTPAALQRHMSATENIVFLLFGPNIPQAGRTSGKVHNEADDTVEGAGLASAWNSHGSFRSSLRAVRESIESKDKGQRVKKSGGSTKTRETAGKSSSGFARPAALCTPDLRHRVMFISHYLCLSSFCSSPFSTPSQIKHYMSPLHPCPG